MMPIRPPWIDPIADSPDVMARYAVPQPPVDLDAMPLVLCQRPVDDDWLDYNGHMNDAFAVLMAGYGCDRFAGAVGVSGAMFSVENHIVYGAEVSRGAMVTVTGQLLNFWPRRWQMLFRLFVGDRQETLAVAIEQMTVHTGNGKAVAFSEDVESVLSAVHARHATLPESPLAGRKVGDPRVSESSAPKPGDGQTSAS